MSRCWRLAALVLLAAGARAEDAEEAGLRLANETPQQAAPPERAWQLSVEPALRWQRRPTGDVPSAQRLALDGSLDLALSPAWRLRAADRLDLLGPDRFAGERPAVNTLKELYLNGRFDADTAFDAGRVNARFGVASGYNPTDWLREGAVRMVLSADPASLRENRLGTVMLRGQRVWNGGSLTALLAPKLADASSSAGLSPDLGATNARSRWLLAWSQRWGEDFTPQWLLHGTGEGHGSPRLGLNLTRLLGRACVAQLEAAGGRAPSLLARAQGTPAADVGWRLQWVAGVSCATPYDQTLTLEFQRNGEALDRAGWRALQAGPMPLYAAYREQAAVRQDLPARDNLFAMLQWRNALVAQLDLAAFIRWNLADRSSNVWAEARYHWGADDLALQWQGYRGQGLSEFGAPPERQLWQLLLRHYF